MKKLIFPAILLAMAAVIFSSCNATDDTPNPSGPNNPDNGSILKFSSLTIGNQKNASVGCFIDLDKGTIYTLQQAYSDQEAIDMIFYHDAPTNDPWLGCPAELSYFTTYTLDIETDATYGVNQWTTKNGLDVSNTDISIATFDAIQSAAALTATVNDDYHAMISAQPDVEAGKVYKFKTNTGRLGLISVKSIDGNSSTSGKMIFDMKVIK